MNRIKKITKRKSNLVSPVNKSKQAKNNLNNPAIKKIVSEFISATSHQFRTPLATIQSSLDLLEYYIKKENTSRQKEIIDKIKRSISFLTETLERITTLYRYNSSKQKLNLKKIIVRKFVNELLEEAVINFERSHLILVNVDDDVIAIKCDEFIIKQILLNLIDNAVKFSPKGGQIRLDIRNVKSNKIEFSVRDEGIGIAKEDLKNLFKPFFRGKNAASIPGVGLGLSIIERLAKIHKAKLECNSTLNLGTEIKVRIPLDKNKK